MSTLLKTKPGGSAKKGLQAPAFAQVNLLPADMRDARKDGMIKRLLLVVLAAVVGLSVLVFLTAAGLELNAKNKLDDAHAETAKLRNEKASLLYVLQTYDQLEAAETAEYVAMAPEINWQTYLDAVTAVLPEEQSLLSIMAEGNTATTVLVDEHPLMRPRVGTVLLTTRSETVPDVAEWMRALGKVPGFQDVFFKTAEVEDEGGVFYKTETTIEINGSGLSDRVVADEVEETD